MYGSATPFEKGFMTHLGVWLGCLYCRTTPRTKATELFTAYRETARQ